MIRSLAWAMSLLLLLLLSRSAPGQSCPHPADLGKAVRRYTGLYKNPAFGYETQLPPGTIGVDSDNPEYQRGFVVFLPKAGGTLSVYAETNSAGYTTATEPAGTDLNSLLTERTHATLLRRVPVRLDSRPAAELDAKFRCPDNAKLYRHIAVFSLGTNRRFLYTLGWEGPADRASEATTLLRALESSWKFIPAR